MSKTCDRCLQRIDYDTKDERHEYEGECIEELGLSLKRWKKKFEELQFRSNHMWREHEARKAQATEESE